MRVTLEAWRKSSLARGDYDFSTFADWPKHALNVAWLWELEREMGSIRGPFYAMWQIHELKRILVKLKSDDHCFDRELLPAKFPRTGEGVDAAIKPLKGEIKEREKAYFDRRPMGKSIWLSKAPFPPQPMLHSHSLAQVAACHESEKDSIFFKEKEVRFGGAYTRIHALEIDWRLTEKLLVEMFRNWLRHGDHDFRPDQQRDSRYRKGHRDTEGLRSYLRDLAIYRLSAAGFTHKEGLKMLNLRMSAPNWERAQRKTNEKIRQRIETLCQVAKLAAVGGGRELYWKDCFIGMDALDDASCL